MTTTAETRNKRQLELGTERIGKLLLRYSIPSIIAMTAASLYNMIDSIFIGRGCGPMAIAGLAVTFPLMNLSAAFGAMVGVGSSTLVSVKMGQKDIEGAENTLGNVVILNTIIGLLFMVVALIFLDPILTFFGASENTLPYAREYMQVLLFGNVLTHLYLGLNDVVRASGYPQRAMAATLTSVGINAVFNYFFIFVLDLGIKGAAIGTLCAQFVAFCGLCYHYTRPDTYIKFKRKIFKFRAKTAKEILSIGCAPFFTNFCACIIVLLINNGLKSNGGDYYVGAYGIANRISFVFIMVANGFNQGMQPILGYNYGAGQVYRSIKAYKLTVVATVTVTTSCFLMSMFFPELAVGLFTSDEEMIEIACHALAVMTCIFPLVGFQITSTGFFMSLGMAHKAVFLSLTRQLLMVIPFLLILPHFFGVDGVWFSMPAADLMSTITVAVMIFFQLRKFNQASQK